VAVFRRDSDTGALTFVETQGYGVGSSADDLDVAHGMAVSPDGRHIYVAGFDDDAVAVFSRDPGTGLFQL